MASLRALVFISSLCVSCGDEATAERAPEPEREWVLLAAPTTWQLAPVDKDPFASQRPAQAPPCDPQGATLEDFGGQLAFEIQTELCNWASIQQPLLGAAKHGERLRLKVWSTLLTSLDEAPAQAYLGLAVGERIIWEQRVSYPQQARLNEWELELPFDLTVGAPLTLHVHNHGANTWSVLEVSALTR